MTWSGDIYFAKEQKAALLTFVVAIGAKPRLGADEARNPRIEGKYGRIYVQPATCEPGKSPKFQIYFLPGRALAWRYTRDALSTFATMTNDGDDEGMFLMNRLPTAAEGEVIRARIGAGI
jgi:hypothetical protein